MLVVNGPPPPPPPLSHAPQPHHGWGWGAIFLGYATSKRPEMGLWDLEIELNLK